MPPTLTHAQRAIAAYNAQVLVVSLAGAVVVLAGPLYTARNYRLSHRGQESPFCARSTFDRRP
jgi:hypothetical protein